MTPEKFVELSQEQQWTMIIAHGVRNALERFHGGKDGIIPQATMPELNRRVRQAILESVYELMHPDQPTCQFGLALAVTSIPDYWEVAELLPEEQALFDEERSSERYAALEKVEHKREAWFKTGKFDG